MYTIYCGDKNLTISSPTDKVGTDAILFHFSKTGIKAVLNALHDNKIQNIVLIADDKEEALNAVKKHYLVIQAGGGLVYTPDDYILLIFRRGKWDLPKGKLDDGEKLPVCAVREVEEETGLSSPLLKEKILITYHIYFEKGVQILKESHWYGMWVPERQTLQPQTEEDIELCSWVAAGDIERYKENMHPSVKDVVDEGLKKIKT